MSSTFMAPLNGRATSTTLTSAQAAAAQARRLAEDPACGHIPKFVSPEPPKTGGFTGGGCVIGGPSGASGAGACGNVPGGGLPSWLTDKKKKKKSAWDSIGPLLQGLNQGAGAYVSAPSLSAPRQINPDWLACREAAAAQVALAEAAEAEAPSEVLEEAKQEIPQWALIAGGVVLAMLVLKK